ncbi:hypothetical protein DPMN_017979 [Dreissena polymorpha]|uniref:Uncharacterized protein n=1 Tax=Dreissena polymorpha TaxID=45954 RepID=A0A9D4NCE6_DREPO|nr:hypothetical protein DPMN_017979 [Dreissena polymorpha]
MVVSAWARINVNARLDTSATSVWKVGYYKVPVPRDFFSYVLDNRMSTKRRLRKVGNYSRQKQLAQRSIRKRDNGRKRCQVKRNSLHTGLTNSNPKTKAFSTIHFWAFLHLASPNEPKSAAGVVPDQPVQWCRLDRS